MTAKKKKLAKTVCFRRTTAKVRYTLSAKKAERNTLKSLELVRIGHLDRREWVESNNDRQWW